MKAFIPAILLLFSATIFLAACGKSDTGAPESASVEATTPPPAADMPTPTASGDPSGSGVGGPIVVTIAADGSFSPDPISPDPGQVVSFHADGQDVVLCVEPADVFGGERFEIPNGSSADLRVQPGAVHVAFAYVAIMGDLAADCMGARGGEGSGTTGP